MQRISAEEGLKLLREADTLELAKQACQVRDSLHPQETITFVIDRNINYTNVCQIGCSFFAFYRTEEHSEAYVLGIEEVGAKVQEAQELGATQVMLQGGLHPSLGLKYFTELFSYLNKNFSVVIHSLSPPEIDHIARLEGISSKEVLDELSKAGLASLPGGGAEVLVDRVRTAISPRKISSGRWLEIMAEAHELGLESTATMMMGTVETDEELLEHLEKIRSLQDRTGGFRAFIPWTFQAGNTELASGRKVSSVKYLRFLALSRLFLDNFKTVQGSWVTQGPRIGQMSIYFGANDLGSLMLEENVVRAAGCAHAIEENQMVRMIQAAGKKAALRNTQYQILKVYE